MIVRHGEKPPDKTDNGPPAGVDLAGVANPHSLTPRGWQRAGALTRLFAPTASDPPAGLGRPGHLYCPDAGGAHIEQRRTYQTIQDLSEKSGIKLQHPAEENGGEADLVASILAECDGVVLICWEHQHIPDLTGAMPTDNRADIPTHWPADRFDLIWSFRLDDTERDYHFEIVAQQLLAGDAPAP